MRICSAVIRLQLVYFDATVFEQFESTGFAYIIIIKAVSGEDEVCVYSGSFDDMLFGAACSASFILMNPNEGGPD